MIPLDQVVLAVLAVAVTVQTVAEVHNLVLLILVEELVVVEQIIDQFLQEDLE
jgi:hypothetical protein